MNNFKLKLATMLRVWADKLSPKKNSIVHQAKNIKDHDYNEHKELVEKLVKLAKMTGWTYQSWNPDSYLLIIWKDSFTEKGRKKLNVHYNKKSSIENFNLTIVVNGKDVHRKVNRQVYVSLLKTITK